MPVNGENLGLKLEHLWMPIEIGLKLNLNNLRFHLMSFDLMLLGNWNNVVRPDIYGLNGGKISQMF